MVTGAALNCLRPFMTDERIMPSFPPAAATTRGYRAIVPIEGYVHKFRLEAREEAAARDLQPEVTGPTVSLGPLLGKFVFIVLALAGIAAAGARVLI